MLRQLSPTDVAPTPFVRTAPPAPGVERPSATQDATTMAAVGLGEPVQGVEAAVRLAASTMFRDRPIEVRGFHDESSGRFVYQIADRCNGEVLMQLPPEALLRFFASARAALGPLVEIEA